MLPWVAVVAINSAAVGKEKDSTYIGFFTPAVLVWVRNVVASHRRLVGESIRFRRKRASLSQEALAEKSDLNPKYVSELERGRVNVSLDALVRISRALSVKMRDLVHDL